MENHPAVLFLGKVISRRVSHASRDQTEPNGRRGGGPLLSHQEFSEGQFEMPKRPRKSSGRMASKGFPNPIDVHVGARIRLRRTLLGISQEKLAEAIGLTFQQVQKYEKGANRVSSSRLADLANALDVEISYFFQEMSAGVSAQTPGELMKAGRRPAVIDNENDPLAKRETLEFVRAYYKIRDAAVRKRLFELTKAVAKSSE
jgi:transcriptional regulator with XRE-family HTH domain